MLNKLDENIISLNEINHTYTLNNSVLEFISVTTYIGEFFEKFDQQKIAKKLIKTNMKYAHLTIDEIIADWNKSRDYGTVVHKEIENDINGIAKTSETRAKNGVIWLNNFLENKSYDLYAEKIIFSEPLKIAGTMDVLIRLKDSNEYIIIDWKTNKDIPRTSYNNKKGIQLETADLLDCKFNHYTLQLSFYRFLLEKKYNFKINNQLIVHITDNSVNAYVTEYLFNHINAIINKLGKN